MRLNVEQVSVPNIGLRRFYLSLGGSYGSIRFKST